MDFVNTYTGVFAVVVHMGLLNILAKKLTVLQSNFLPNGKGISNKAKMP